jgi:LmbE family N-acetylglucosaminyl deacetylase
MGGVLLLSHDRGIETFVVCLTSGEAATHRGATRNSAELAATRKLEFAASCEHLSVTHGEVLDFPDGKLDRQNPFELACELARHIRAIKPHVIVTFGPEGSVTGHTDHGMASVFATLAFQWAGRPNRFPGLEADGLQPWRAQKLYYTSASFVLPDRPPISPAPASALIDIGPVRLERKIEAFKKHTTQAPLFAMFETHTRRRGPFERFHLAACITPGMMRMETDLFEGSGRVRSQN